MKGYIEKQPSTFLPDKGVENGVQQRIILCGHGLDLLGAPLFKKHGERRVD